MQSYQSKSICFSTRDNSKQHLTEQISLDRLCMGFGSSEFLKWKQDSNIFVFIIMCCYHVNIGLKIYVPSTIAALLQS